MMPENRSRATWVGDWVHAAGDPHVRFPGVRRRPSQLLDDAGDHYGSVGAPPAFR